MKIIGFVLLVLLGLVNCTTQTPPAKEENSISFEPNDEGDYDLIVFDLGYQNYLLTIAKPMNFYSENYYKVKNRIYVDVWNYRVSMPFQFDPDLYTLRIDYDPTVEYGINLEYKLFNYFKFVEWKYKTNLAFGG